MYHNIEHTYCSCENENSITKIDTYIEMLEHPYKFIENSFWLDEITHLASREGCGILLNGQFGNATVSYGNFVVHIKTLVKEKKYAKAIRDTMYYSNFMDRPLWNETKRMLKIVLPKSVLKALGKEQIYRENVPVDADLAKKYNVDERLKKCCEGSYADYLSNVYDMRKYFTNPNLLSQIGELDTKYSLAYGIQVRDPSIDVRVIEYCYSIPYELYVIKGRERELIRMAMKNILPDKVRLNYRNRGLQSADWVQRLHPFMGSIKEELSRLLKNDLVCYYIDVKKVKKALADLPEKIYNYNREFRMLIVVVIFGRFIEAYENM
jgi:asparagine synthase (glutamine-hydrolysing)